ncbi:acetyltransferase (GNAT) family protein [Paenibacillus methanolicus]|uniref:Acetyltransferase (GNAT) family protein n=1 Tax=Paenibacillus methanolicus TaxID=582686 RepID=A0A5S5BUZ9_9BACL|nr:acetyltransferase (GNAT) family protein [Paenibacillus methanolicus]
MIPLADYGYPEQAKRLLAMCIWPDPASLDRAWARYREDGCLLFGRVVSSELAGLIGIREENTGEYELLHLAVRPSDRGHGIGSGMIAEWMRTRPSAQLIAETDAEAVGFYAKIGFRVYSLGETYPGIERFRCVLRKREPCCEG